MATAKKKTVEQVVVQDGAEEVCASCAIPAMDEAQDSTREKKTVTKKVLPKVDLDELVDVRSNYAGTLYFRARSGQEQSWAEYGMVSPMSVRDVLAIRNESPAFFRNGWISLVGDNAESVSDYLQLHRYGADMIQTDFDELLEKSVDEIQRVVSALPQEAVESLARRANALIEAGKLDSKQKIKALSDLLGYELDD